MCGIVGYIGKKEALPILLQGLRSLEYRGYDSAGLVLIHDGKLSRVRAVGKVDFLAQKIKGQDLKGTAGIAHTRWATHGRVTEENAHPHIAAAGKLALVHNGIIENYRELKEKLKDHKFQSETDSEVLAALIASHYQGDLLQAVRIALPQVRGTYGILVLHADHPDTIVAARLGSPLVVGIGEEEYYAASDVTPMLAYTKKVTYLDDGEIAEITANNLRIINLKDEVVTKGVSEINWNHEQAQKQGFAHFMLKEIFDQPTVFEDAIRGRLLLEEGTAKLGGFLLPQAQMRKIEKIMIIAEGTAYHAGLVAKYAFERLAEISTEVDFSSEFRYRDPIIGPNTLAFVVSQSGETADTLMALREAKRKGAEARAIVNTVGSTIAREAGAGSYIHAGPELAVASTKAYTNMIALFLLYAIVLGRSRRVAEATGQRLLRELLEIPRKMSAILEKHKELEVVAKKYKGAAEVFFLGRGINYPVALEGALKLKEISYLHSEGFAGGQMKHGPLALVSEKTLVVGIVTQNQLRDKISSNIQEAKARGAKTLLIATEGDEEVKELADDIFYVPKTMELLEPILNTIPLQLFAYYVAVALGRDVDRPRNLAKSVTVE